MLYAWKEEMISFMVDASEYGRFHAQLAAHLRALLPPQANVCDAGCGIGYLTLALAPLCAHVTAVDVSAPALAVLRRNLDARGIANVSVVHAPIAAAAPEQAYDAMIFCSFGSIHEILRTAQAQCRGTVLVVKKLRTRPRFGVSAQRRHHTSAEQVQAELERLGIPFAAQELLLPFGQPFRSKADAVRFFEVYNPNCEISPAWVEEKLVETGRDDFPLFLPEAGRTALLTFSAQDIPAEWEDALD